MRSDRFSNLKRHNRHRPLRRRIVIVTEGTKTEISYFNAIKPLCRDDLYLDVSSPDHSSPKHILQKLKSIYREAANTSHLELWAVVDYDNWQSEDIQTLAKWLADQKKGNKCANAGLLLSCPKFEFWLLLHFEDGLAIQSAESVDSRLQKYLPQYKKEFPPSLITPQSVQQAILRCEKICSVRWPETATFPPSDVLGASRVHILLKEILRNVQN